MAMPDLEDIVVEISKDGKTGWGTGFFITRDEVATCYHVLAGNESVLSDIYYIKHGSWTDWTKATPINAKCNGQKDYAVLHCEGSIPSLQEPTLEKWDGSSYEFHSYGYGYPQVEDIEAYHIEGSIDGYIWVKGQCRLQLKATAGTIQYGRSGSPVLSSNQKSIVGIMYLAGGMVGNDNQLVLAIPIEDLTEKELCESVFSKKIEEILSQGRFDDWIITFIRENGLNELDEMLQYLSGSWADGVKKILSGYSYWGIVPTGKWIMACRDPNYLMNKSIRNFPKKWKLINNLLNNTIPYNYVSLGVGDGQKDYLILNDLIKKNPNIDYFPIDMSPEMLYQGTRHVLDKFGDELRRNQILALQVDFEDQERLYELRGILNRLNDKKPTIFSLLGNTLANFDYDTNLLSNLANILLKSNDLLLLEIARVRNIEEESRIQNEANWEYTSESFKDFAISSLIQATDIVAYDSWISPDFGIETIPESSKKKAFVISIWYKNIGEKELKIRLLNNKSILFPPRDKIRLYLSRKYTDDGINYMINHSRLERIPLASTVKEEWNAERDNSFIELLLLRKQGLNPK